MERNILVAGSLVAMLSAYSPAHAQGFAIQLSEEDVATISSSVSSAQTPEEAARLFARAASGIIGQAVADGLTQFLTSTVQATQPTSAITGWQDYILENGLAMHLQWPSPELSPVSALPFTTVQGRSPEGTDGAAPAGVTGSISITIGGNF